ncbi:8327_t:CDS:2, partial [Dentiscutata erythropus]
MAFMGNLDLDKYDVQYRTWLSKRTDSNKKSYNDIRHTAKKLNNYYNLAVSIKDKNGTIHQKLYKRILEEEG